MAFDASRLRLPLALAAPGVVALGTLALVAWLASFGGPTAGSGALPEADPEVATFSIVAFDPVTGDVGVAVQSKVFGAGVVVPWVRADVGAVATQAAANVQFGPEGLDLMDDGLAAPLALERLVASDARRDRRQVGMVDARGRAAAFTGDQCHAWAGQIVAKHYCCQGNILASASVVKRMAAAYEIATGPLAERMVEALRAAQKAGGDKRGRQSACVLVARRFGGYGGGNDRYIDIRVDDHATPIEELARLLAMRRTSYPKSPVAPRVAGLVREPRTGTVARPSARETWLHWTALHAAQDWTRIYALATSQYRDEHTLVQLERSEKGTRSPQARARAGVYLGTALEGAQARLHFAVPGAAEPVMVLLTRHKGAWHIVP